MMDTAPLSDKSAGFFYIPAAALGYIYTLNQNNLYLTLALITLVCATFQHGFIQSIYGPKGLDRDPLPREEVAQRTQAAIWDNGFAADYPESLFQSGENIGELSLKRGFVAILAGLSTVGVIIGYIVVSVHLFTIVSELNYIGIVLLFLLLLWFLQTVLWLPWSSVYLTEKTKQERADHREYIRNEMSRFAYFVQDEADLQASDVGYWSVDGGTIKPEFDSDGDSEEIPEEEIEVIMQGFVAFMDRADVPIEHVEGFIKYGGNDAHRFVIDSTWATAYSQGEIEYTEYREKVLETIEFGQTTTG